MNTTYVSKHGGPSEGKQIHKVSDYRLVSHIFIRLGHIVGNVYSVHELEIKNIYIYCVESHKSTKNSKLPPEEFHYFSWKNFNGCTERKFWLYHYHL